MRGSLSLVSYGCLKYPQSPHVLDRIERAFCEMQVDQMEHRPSRSSRNEVLTVRRLEPNLESVETPNVGHFIPFTLIKTDVCIQYVVVFIESTELFPSKWCTFNVRSDKGYGVVRTLYSYHKVARERKVYQVRTYTLALGSAQFCQSQ